MLIESSTVGPVRTSNRNQAKVLNWGEEEELSSMQALINILRKPQEASCAHCWGSGSTLTGSCCDHCQGSGKVMRGYSLASRR